ncbi:MAG: aminotransferase class I/II-fold pyridoxal phosphate-dependent enzyme, partial [Clostridiales bacterium]|nr:aminotransferase class I/II-fold pyridoxal phosphate-dependent enzyme [Clostridiales bacterium]
MPCNSFHGMVVGSMARTSGSSSRMTNHISGGVPVTVETKAEDGFRLTAEALRKAITPKTKLLILSYPNNPTGAVMRRKDLEAVADVIRGTDIMV